MSKFEAPPKQRTGTRDPNMVQVRIDKYDEGVDNTMVNLYEKHGYEAVSESKGGIVMQISRDAADQIGQNAIKLHRERANQVKKTDLSGTGATIVQDETEKIIAGTPEQKAVIMGLGDEL